MPFISGILTVELFPIFIQFINITLGFRYFIIYLNAFFGVGVNPQIARTYKLAVSEGVLVAQVVDSSPVSRAGLREGDIIVSFNGDKITSMGEIQERLRKYQVGTQIDITVVRGQRQRVLPLILGEVPA